MNIGNKEKEKFGLYETIEKVYDFIASNPSDQKGKNSIQWIAHYMPILYEHSKDCDSIVEIGVNQVNSTWAFLNARPKNGVISIDIDLNRSAYMTQQGLSENIWLSWAKHLSEKEEVAFSPVESDSLQAELPEIDLLFIDSLHTYEHLRAELFLHGPKAQKYIILHDTTLYPELVNAVDEFLNAHEQFVIKEQHWDEPGLTILKRDDE